MAESPRDRLRNLAKQARRRAQLEYNTQRRKGFGNPFAAASYDDRVAALRKYRRERTRARALGTALPARPAPLNTSRNLQFSRRQELGARFGARFDRAADALRGAYRNAGVTGVVRAVAEAKKVGPGSGTAG